LGIVFKQSLKNTLIIYIAFAFGGINALFLYTTILEGKYYGLVTFLLSTANLIMPITAFGVHYTIVKFFSSYNTKKEKDAFLSSALLLPLFIAIPIGFFGNIFYEQVSVFLSSKNPIIKEYTFIIYLIAVFTAYFEIFYAWSKVQLQSVFGNVLKELWNRVVVMVLLLLVYLEVISKPQFIYILTASYFVRTIVMMLYAFKYYLPRFTLKLPSNFIEVLKYSGYIILAGSAGAFLLDIDKFMIPKKKAIEMVAYYSVGVYVGSVIEAPGRAMAQILSPITSKALNENNVDEIDSLYKRSSINLLLICGLFFLLINLNISEMYKLLDKEYAGGILVVLMISLAKLFTMSLGNNGAIISNSKHYKILLPYGIFMALSVYYLNLWLIDLIGINGAALSTLIVIFVFNILKIWYVKRTFNMIPFTVNTYKLLLVLVLFFSAFYFWHFSFHPVVNILLKSTLITLLYLIVIKKIVISEEINNILDKYLPF